jgi:hypothetical protein
MASNESQRVSRYWTTVKQAVMSPQPDDLVTNEQHSFQMAAGLAPEADDAINRFAAWARPKLGLAESAAESPVVLWGSQGNPPSVQWNQKHHPERTVGSAPGFARPSAGHAGEHARLVGAPLLVHDHGEPVGRVDHGDQGDQRDDLVVVVVLAYLGPGLVGHALVGVGYGVDTALRPPY